MTVQRGRQGCCRTARRVNIGGQHDQRSAAVITELKRLVPNEPTELANTRALCYRVAWQKVLGAPARAMWRAVYFAQLDVQRGWY